ncbi:MAG: hypothetical protein HY280_06965 [Nitrospinae bacterium]|nr:hypothetical protein [Nitrospinota bacterium]
MKLRKRGRSLFLALLLALLQPPQAGAFYESNDGEQSLEARGFLDFSGGYSLNPNFPKLYPHASDQTYGAAARLLADGKLREWAGFEFNGVAYGYGSSAPFATAADVERSPAPEWMLGQDGYFTSRLAVDHLNLRLSSDNADLIAGRQAINMATCFYFTPNDFFAPFSAQTFFRVYKPGVDAARFEYKLGELSQLTLVASEGYAPDSTTSNGWGTPDNSRATYLARASATFADFHWAALGGKSNGAGIVGGSLQGEVFGKIGIRGEGHYSSGVGNDYGRLALGVERRFSNGLSARYEEFYNGAGAGASSQYVYSTWGNVQYHAMNYGAVGLDYQFSPLLTGDALVIGNYTDGSQLAAFYAVYSLSDNSELSAGLNVPFGPSGRIVAGLPPSVAIDSEYGLLPYSASVDLRIYF